MQTLLEASAQDNIPPEFMTTFETLRPYFGIMMHTHSTEGTNKINTPDSGSPEEVISRFEVMDLANQLGIEAVVFEDHASSPDRPVPLESNHRVTSILLGHGSAVDEYNASGESKVQMINGVETSLTIDYSGSPRVDIHPEDLKHFTVVTASIHSLPGNVNSRDPELLEHLYTAAATNPDIDVIGHMLRHREFYPNDWNYFSKYYRDANPEISAKIEALDQYSKTTGDYSIIKKIIGKIPMDPNDHEQTIELSKLFTQLEDRYWQMVENILTIMEQNGTAFEINLNVFRPDKAPFKRILELAADKPLLPISISFDLHNPKQLLELAKRIPGLVQLLQSNNITPDRVVNSTAERFEAFLASRR